MRNTKDICFMVWIRSLNDFKSLVISISYEQIWSAFQLSRRSVFAIGRGNKLMPIIKWPTKSWLLINPTRALGARFLDYLIGKPNPAVLPRGAGA